MISDWKVRNATAIDVSQPELPDAVSYAEACIPTDSLVSAVGHVARLTFVQLEVG